MPIISRALILSDYRAAGSCAASVVAAERIRHNVCRRRAGSELIDKISVLRFLACFKSQRIYFVLLCDDLRVFILNTVCDEFIVKRSVICVSIVYNIAEACAE